MGKIGGERHLRERETLFNLQKRERFDKRSLYKHVSELEQVQA